MTLGRVSIAAAAVAAVAVVLAGLVILLAGSDAAGAASSGSAAKPLPPADFRKAASKLEMVVLYPTDTRGLKLGFAKKIVDPYCTKRGTESLRGIYTVRGSQTRIIELFEGHPRYCNGTSLWPIPAGQEVRVHGRAAILVDLCDVRDCFFPEGAWGLEWCERGTTVQLIADGVRGTRLLEIGRSMRPVDGARATSCPPRGA